MSASATLAAPPASIGRALNITLWVLQVLLAVLFVFGGINKLAALQPEVVQGFAKIGLGQWFRYFVGALELAGGVGLLIPRLSGLAAIGLAGVMVGAVFTHVLVMPPAHMAVFPGTLAVVFGLIAWGRWPATKGLVGKLLR